MTARTWRSAPSSTASIAACAVAGPNSSSKRAKPPLADPGRADHRREVAAELARVTDVQDDRLEHVGAQRAGVVELERRDPDALLPDLGRAGVVGAVGGAADVALMRAVDRPEREALAVEHRDEGGEIRQVVAAVVGVVEQIDVARADRAAKAVVHRFRRPGQRADVDRHVLGLRDQAALGIADGGREIAARVDDLGVRGAQHRLAHLLGDRVQAMLDHGDRDRIDLDAAAHRTLVPGADLPKTGPHYGQTSRAVTIGGSRADGPGADRAPLSPGVARAAVCR